MNLNKASCDRMRAHLGNDYPIGHTDFSCAVERRLRTNLQIHDYEDEAVQQMYVRTDMVTCCTPTGHLCSGGLPFTYLNAILPFARHRLDSRPINVCHPGGLAAHQW